MHPTELPIIPQMDENECLSYRHIIQFRLCVNEALYIVENVIKLNLGSLVTSF